MGGEIEMLWDAQGRVRLIRGFLHSVIMKKTRKFKVRIRCNIISLLPR